MPIYEYSSADPATACAKCRGTFEVIRRANAGPVSSCPQCGAAVERVVSRCRAVVSAQDASGARIGRSIAEYEKNGLWSHAAELADSHAAKTRDPVTRDRALENYRKAGYDAASVERHAAKVVAASPHPHPQPSP